MSTTEKYVPSSEEDIFRQQVLTLFSRSNHDVSTLMKGITRALNTSGRTDVTCTVDDQGISSTLTQSQFHSTTASKMNFQLTLDRIANEARERILAANPAAIAAKGIRVTSPPPAVKTTTTTTTTSTTATTTTPAPAAGTTTATTSMTTKPELVLQHAMVKVSKKLRSMSAGPTSSGPKPPHHKSFRKEPVEVSSAFPTSKYNGNYLLQRYGGQFPKHGNYGFYRRYGTEGRGAATSATHNMPNGLKPDTSIVYS